MARSDKGYLVGAMPDAPFVRIANIPRPDVEPLRAGYQTLAGACRIRKETVEIRSWPSGPWRRAPTTHVRRARPGRNLVERMMIAATQRAGRALMSYENSWLETVLMVWICKTKPKPW